MKAHLAPGHLELLVFMYGNKVHDGVSNCMFYRVGLFVCYPLIVHSSKSGTSCTSCVVGILETFDVLTGKAHPRTTWSGFCP